MPGTLLVLDPASNEIDGKKMLGGALWDSDTKVIRVKTDNSILTGITSQASYQDMLNLEAELRANPGTVSVPTRIVSSSRGGSIACSFFRSTFLHTGINPALYSWHLCGCPDMKFTGANYLWPNIDKSVYPGDGTKCGKGGGPHDSTCLYPYPSGHGTWGQGSGIPATMPWDVTWYANQYDGWADAPVNWASVPSLDERQVFLGMTLRYPWFDNTGTLSKILSRLRSGDTSPHTADPNYYRAGISGSPGTVTYTDPAQPTQKYVWRTTYPMPYAIENKWLRFWARAKDLKQRPIWEAAWSRPVTVPLPDYASLPSWIPFKG